MQTIRSGDSVEWVRGENRTKINNNANCFPPLSPELAKKLGFRINCNFGDLMIALSHARRQFMTAFWSNSHFFKVTIPLAPAESQSEWGAFISEQINRPMRKNLEYYELHRSRWASVACHGTGPQTWYKKDWWKPDYVAIADLRIPTDTLLDFSNLDWWAVRHSYGVFELIEKVFTKKKNSGWNKKEVMRILKNYKELNFQDATLNYDWETNPEKLADIIKQNGSLGANDALPTIQLWYFYFKDFDEAGKPGIYMRIVPENSTVREGTDEVFLWESETPIAEKREQLLHCQFGDLNNDAPFLYHSQRSLGFALLEPTYYTNLARCRALQHMMDQFNIWLRITDPPDKARAQIQEFNNLSVIRPGVTVVPQTERHQIDSNFLEMMMAQLKQLQGEASAAYTQQLDTGTQKEQTAFETRVKLEQVNAMMGGILLNAFKYAQFEYEEICRRFCLPRSTDPDILMFQKRCRQAKIPTKWLDVDLWDVEPVTPLGMGNPTMAAAEAQELMQARGAYDPEAQQEILHEFTLVTTKDPRKAARWAPLGKKKGASNAQKFAEADFTVLMRGLPADAVEDQNLIGQIETLLGLLSGEITIVTTKLGGMADIREIVGLQNVEQHIGQLLEMVAGDEANAELINNMKKALGKLSNDTKGFIQRLQQQQKAAQQQNGEGGLSPEVTAKIHAQMATSAAKIAAKEKSDAQKMKQRGQQFVMEERRKDAQSFAEIQREAVKNRFKAVNGSKGKSNA